METTTIMISTIATAISAVVATATLVLAYLKYREKVKAEHAERMFDLLTTTRKDPNVVNFFERIDYSENGWYGEGFTHSESEPVVDNALLQFEHILYLKAQKLLNKEEFSHYQYEIDKIVSNRDVQRYFFNLYHYTQRAKLPFKFTKLLEYGIAKQYIDKDFFNKDSYNYGNKVLNF